MTRARKAYEFARATRRNPARTYLAYYDRHDVGHETERENGVRIYHLNRTQAIEEMFQTFEAGLVELPRDARYLGGRVRDGMGDYYRQMTALTRLLEKNAAGNLVARFSDGGKDDHYHAETYCLQAMRISEGAKLYSW